MKIGIIGLGLIGASFGRAAVKAGHKVFGLDADENVLVKAEMIKAADGILNEKNAGEIDLLVSAVYPSAFESAVKPFLPLLKDGAVVMDFSGIKRGVVAAMREFAERYPALDFIGGHPMAGREFSGIDRSTTTLFNKASMIFVPVRADIFALDRLKSFFISMGFGEVVITTAENHDRMIAFTSQLCHVVSNAFIKSPTAKEHFGYSAGSYKDLTRVARLNPEMWAELMIKNGDYLGEEVRTLIENLEKYLSAIEKGDKQTLKKLLKEGSDIKISLDQRSK